MHLLAEAFSDLSGLREFPMTPAVCLASILGMLFLEQIAAAFMHHYSTSGNGHSHAGHGHETSPDPSNVSSEKAEMQVEGHAHMHHHPTISAELYSDPRALLIAHVLEFGIIVHSVIIGIDLGVTTEIGELRPLIIAICFHQIFEGVGLGCAIAVARVSRLKGVIFSTIFSLTTPIGIAIGIWIASSYDPESNRAFWVKGMLNAVASGILIYAGLVDMLVEDFSHCDNSRPLKKAAMAVAVLAGYGLMTLLANWA